MIRIGQVVNCAHDGMANPTTGNVKIKLEKSIREDDANLAIEEPNRRFSGAV